MDFQIYRHKYKVQVNKQQEYYVCTFLLQSNIFTCTSLKKKMQTMIGQKFQCTFVV